MLLALKVVGKGHEARNVGGLCPGGAQKGQGEEFSPRISKRERSSANTLILAQ